MLLSSFVQYTRVVCVHSSCLYGGLSHIRQKVRLCYHAIISMFLFDLLLVAFCCQTWGHFFNFFFLFPKHPNPWLVLPKHPTHLEEQLESLLSCFTKTCIIFFICLAIPYKQHLHTDRKGLPALVNLFAGNMLCIIWINWFVCACAVNYWKQLCLSNLLLSTKHHIFESCCLTEQYQNVSVETFIYLFFLISHSGFWSYLTDF